MSEDIKKFVEAYLQQDKAFQEEIRERMRLIDVTLSTLIVYNNNSYSTQRQKDVLLSSYRKNVKRIETILKVEYPNMDYSEFDAYIEDYLKQE